MGIINSYSYFAFLTCFQGLGIFYRYQTNLLSIILTRSRFVEKTLLLLTLYGIISYFFFNQTLRIASTDSESGHQKWM